MAAVMCRTPELTSSVTIGVDDYLDVESLYNQ